MIHPHSLDFGVDVARGYVSGFGPVTIDEIRRHLRVQTSLGSVERDAVILRTIEDHCQQYDNQVGAYWLKD